MSDKIERCVLCDNPTGRAGKCEDSIYVESPDGGFETGPVCPECEPLIRYDYWGNQPRVINQLYRPSNGSEGDSFFSQWCRHCARDNSMSEGAPIDDCDDNEKCGIIGRSFAFDIDHPEYPKEWQKSPKGPICTAFVPVGEPVPADRDDRTIDMFGVAK